MEPTSDARCTMTRPGDLPNGLADSRREWIAAVDGTDLDAYADLVCEDVVWMPPGGEPVHGRDAFREWCAPFFEAYAYEFEVDDATVRAAGGRAVETGTFRSRMTSRSAGETMEHVGRFVILWRRDEDGTWRIERYADLTPPGPASSG